MKPDIRIGWFTVAILVALALAMVLCSRIAGAESTSIAERVASVVPSLADKREETVDPAEFGRAVADATTSPEWAALLVTTAAHESAFRARIARSEYRAGEGDHGHAWGLFQNWLASSNADVWGSPDIATQVRAASHLTRQYYDMCRGSGVPFPLSTMRALGGRGCALPLKGEAQRLQTYRRVLARLR